MLKETLKQEIDKLNENQLRKIADFVALIKTQAQQLSETVSFWQRATPVERSQDFRAWVAQLPKTNLNLPDEAFDRGSSHFTDASKRMLSDSASANRALGSGYAPH